MRILDEIICIPIDKTKKPIIFENDFNPACPVYFKMRGAIENIPYIQSVTPSIAIIIIPVFCNSGYSIDLFINNEMVPGPAKRGVASGLREISSFSIDSFIILPLISPLCFEFSNKNPERDIIIPPAIFKAAIEIPKKRRICEPIK